jgi:hypothetical protein
MRAATRHYLKNPDPVGWLALADALDEAGGAVEAFEAMIWRARARWFGPLMEALALASRSDVRQAYSVEVGPGCRVVFQRMAAKPVVLARALLPPGTVANTAALRRLCKGAGFDAGDARAFLWDGKGGHVPRPEDHDRRRRHKFVLDLIDPLAADGLLCLEEGGA